MRGGGRTVAVLYASVMPSACAAENVTQPSVAGAVHVNVCDRAGMGENQASPQVAIVPAAGSGAMGVPAHPFLSKPCIAASWAS